MRTRRYRYFAILIILAGLESAGWGMKIRPHADICQVAIRESAQAGLASLDSVAPSDDPAGSARRYALKQQFYSSLPAYSPTNHSVFHFRTRNLELALEISPRKDSHQFGDRITQFSLQYRPAIVGYPTSLSTIFGSKRLNLDQRHISYAGESFFTGLNGSTFELILNWREGGKAKSALLMLSAEDGRMVFYPGSTQSPRSHLAHELGVLVQGLLAETVTNIWRPKGQWHFSNSLIEADFSLEGEITPVAPVVE
jgi:hypothetical protein